MIEVETFTEVMKKHWEEELGNVPSSALKNVWRQLCNTFNNHIESHESSNRRDEWTVLQPPTGTGKSQGTAVYCSMLSSLPEEKHPGVLIVTRQKADADQMAKTINQLSGKKVAVAYHSDTKKEISLTEVSEWPVLVITHRAYELAMDYLGQDGSIQQTWEFFHDWQLLDRKLVVIDEALDIIEHSQAGLEGLRQTMGAIPQKLRNRFPQEIVVMEKVIKVLERFDDKTNSLKEHFIENDFMKDKLNIDLTELRKAMHSEVRYDRQVGRNDNHEQRRLRNIHDTRLRSLNIILRSWVYYGRYDASHTFNTARLLVPDGIKGAVVLDATASSNVLYDLFDNAIVVTPPPPARSYRNVTLHVSRGHKVGKRYMRNNAKKVTSELISELSPLLEGKKSFICTHKDLEPLLLSYKVDSELMIGHWGAVDGSNKWKDCDTAVIFGLPYRPDVWTANVFMALQGIQSSEWFNNEGEREWGKHKDIRKALKHGQIITSIVQAINRVRCRKVVDGDGNCQLTDVYILLPDNTLADEIIEGIKKEMPDIKLKDWKFSGAKSRVKRSKYQEAFIKYIQSVDIGRYSSSKIKGTLGFSQRTLERLIAATKDKASDISKAMEEVNCRFMSEGKGRGKRSFFVKEWIPT